MLNWRRTVKNRLSMIKYDNFLLLLYYISGCTFMALINSS